MIFGLGITISPERYVERELKNGTLVKLFPKVFHVLRQDQICVMKTRQNLPKIRAVLDYFKQDFR
jgi:DNA-binding transcriptional LysR family regulator